MRTFEEEIPARRSFFEQDLQNRKGWSVFELIATGFEHPSQEHIGSDDGGGLMAR